MKIGVPSKRACCVLAAGISVALAIGGGVVVASSTEVKNLDPISGFSAATYDASIVNSAAAVSNQHHRVYASRVGPLIYRPGREIPMTRAVPGGTSVEDWSAYD